MTATAADYQRIFDLERVQTYPVVEAYEASCGFHVEREKLEAAARVLACPLKVHAPNWQHGRVLYALYRRSFADRGLTSALLLDIGTAKGFSALVARWAALDAGVDAAIVSCDVLTGIARRNSVLEVDGPKTLSDFLAPWPEAKDIAFCQGMTGVEWLRRHHDVRIHAAFVDGKHSFAAVTEEARMLAERQEPGDVVMFDDAQIPDVAKAITTARDHYAIEYVTIAPGRTYAIGVRRG